MIGRIMDRPGKSYTPGIAPKRRKRAALAPEEEPVLAPQVGIYNIYTHLYIYILVYRNVEWM